MIGVRPRDARGWVFPSIRFRQVNGTVTLIGNESYSILASAGITDSHDAYRTYGVLGIVSPSRLAPPITGRTSKCSLLHIHGAAVLTSIASAPILFETMVPLYTSLDIVPPPQPVIDLAATLAAAFHHVVPGLMPELDAHMGPAHLPYGETTLVAINRLGREKVQV